MKDKRKMDDLDRLKDLFWDYRWDSVVENLSSPFVIARVLELGNSEQVDILIKQIGEDALKQFIEKYAERLLSKISYNFWKIYYEKNFVKRA